MRLRRLDLIRYGMFTDEVIDFGKKKAGSRDLHIVYGPNETGKTTAVSAYLDLIYGIKSGRYAFQHPESSMRIGGLLELGGQLLEFIRVKSASNSLLDAHGQPIAESAIRAELGAIERDGYRSMFSLDDDTLEEGGEDILKSRGDLGQLLFSASAGLSELSQQLVKVRGEADTFYKYRGRQTNLAKFKEKLATLKNERDAIDTQASKYTELVQARDQLNGQYTAALEVRNAAQARTGEVQRYLLALPSLIRLHSLRDQLAPLRTIPEAPQAWVEELPNLIRQELTLDANLATNTQRIEKLEAGIAGMVVDQGALALVERMDQLGELRARHVTAVKDIPRLKLELEDVEGAIRAMLVQVGHPGEVDPQHLVLEATTVSRLRDLMEVRSGIEAEKQRAGDELAQAEQDLEQAKADVEGAGGAMSGDDARMEALSKAVTATRAVDHPGRCRVVKRLSTEANVALQARLGEIDPWQGDGATLTSMVVPSEEDIHGWKLTLADAQRRIDQYSSEIERITSDVSRLTVERDAIGGTTGVVTDEEAGKIRTARELAWAEHRRALDDATADGFEAALRRDDLVVSGRVMHATELASLHRTSQDLAVRKEECRRATELLEQTTENQKILLEEVAAAIGTMSLPTDMSLAQMEDWLTRRSRTLEAIRLAEKAELELHAAEDDAKVATERLATAMKAAGLVVKDGLVLDDLLVEADVAISTEATLKHLKNKVRECEREMKRRTRADEQAKAADADWISAWTEACADCWLGEGGIVPTPVAVRGIIEALGELGPALTTKASLVRRICGMQRDQESFSSEVTALAAQLGLTVKDTSDTAKEIVDVVKAAETAQTLRTEADSVLVEARKEKEVIEDAKAILENAKGKMTALFGVSTLEEVDAKLSGLAQRAELGKQLDQVESEILGALRFKTISEAEAALEAMDRDALERELINLKGRFDNEDARCRELFTLRSKAVDAVEAIGGDARVAAIEERRRTTLIEIEEEARRYLRFRMGAAAAEQALRIYRDHHRSSMMNRASEAFATISRGAYSRLEPQRRKDSEVLLAITATNGSKEAEQLSKGTRFQLYLALRVAGYHEFVRTRTPVPFISDDIMETFDDFRAEEAFKLFADMADLGQVIYLTHHDHLCDIAARVCPDAQIHRLGQVAVSA